MQIQLAHWDKYKTKVLIFALIGLYLLLFLPFWQPVLLAFLFASACEPFVNRARQHLHTKRTWIAYSTVGLSLVLFIGLISVVSLQAFSQIYDLFRSPEAMAQFNGKIVAVRDQFLGWASHQSLLSSINVKAQLDHAVIGGTDTAKKFLLEGAQIFISQTPVILLDLFIFIAAFGAFLVIQPRIWSSLAQALGLGEAGKKHIRNFERICGLALGSVILTGLFQTILVVIGAAIAGFGSLFMIFGVTFIFSMIPVLGAGLVPAFLAIVSFVSGSIMMCVIMAITAAIVGVADNVLRAWLFSRAAQSNPVISIISLLGGISLFGFAGLFIAPVLEQLVMTYAFTDVQPASKPAKTTSDRFGLPVLPFENERTKNENDLVLN